MTNFGAALMYYTTRLDEVIADLAQHRLNTLYPAVWNRGYTLHSSQIAFQAGSWSQDPFTSLPLLPFQNKLWGLVHQAHRQHLRLIPWFEYGLMLPVRSPIARKHPDWLTTTQSGSKGNGWLNPFHPQVQQFLTDLIVEVVQRYPVDGIQLDDHFGLPIEFGYDSYTIKLYQADHRGAKPPNNPAAEEWIAWRAERLTQLMAKISKAVKATRQGAVVSLSPHPPNFAYHKYLQDWTRWVNLGLVDEVVVQVYRQDLAALKAQLYNGGFRPLLRQNVPITIGLYTGPFLAAKQIQSLGNEVEAVRVAGYKGVSFFCWETTFWLFKGSSEKQVRQTFLKLFPADSNASIKSNHMESVREIESDRTHLRSAPAYTVSSIHPHSQSHSEEWLRSRAAFKTITC
jgi:uncharacterized lipoprotein YddW (UPF0748 family)